MPTTSHNSTFERELAGLNRHYAPLIRKLRLQAFGERIAHGTAGRVLRNTCGFSGDRWVLYMADGSALRLKLYWARRADVVSIQSCYWYEGEGWRVGVRTLDHETMMLRAFFAELHLARSPRPVTPAA